MNRAEKRRRKKLAKRSGLPDPHIAMLLKQGYAAYQAGNLQAAKTRYQQILQKDGRQPDAMYLLGVVALETGRPDIAVKLIGDALRIRPGLDGARGYYGDALRRCERWQEAVDQYEKARRKDPENTVLIGNLGLALTGLRRFDEAEAAFDEALRLRPDFYKAKFALGNVYHEQRRLQDAVAMYREAIALRTDDPGCHISLGNALRDLGRLNEAAAAYQTASECEAESEAKGFLAALELTQGHFDTGWEGYQTRPNIPDADRYPGLRDKPWRGEDLTDKTIAVLAEQGIGDEIMFATQFADLKAMGCRVTVECDARLLPLYQRVFADWTFVAKSDPPNSVLNAGDFDFAIPLGSLAQSLRPGFDAFPRQASFLKADGARTKQLRERYREWSKGKPVIGISWRSANKGIMARKSIDLVRWAPIVAQPDFTFLSLQYGDVQEDLMELEKACGVQVLLDPDIDPLTDMDAAAAQIAAVDGILSISNATVHLAGALGVPVWVLLSHVPDWRWFLDRDDSPWYQSVRLYRQPAPEDWDSVLDLVAQDLKTGKLV